MKKQEFFLLVFCILLLLPLYGQGFRKTYEMGLKPKFLDVIINNDTIVSYGQARDSVTGQQGIIFMKLDTFGNVLSEKIYTDTVILTTQYWRQGLILTQDGGYAIAGTIWAEPGVPFLLKVHSDLSLDFIKKYPHANVNTGNSSLLEIESGGFMVVGEQVNWNDNRDVIVIKTDAEGNQKWRKRYGSLDLQESAAGIREFSPNKFVITGLRSNYHFSTQATYGKAIVLEIDSLGNQIDEWESGVELGGGVLGYRILPDSSWICSSGTWEYAAQYGTYMSQSMIFRMDKNRNIMWTKKLGRLFLGNRLQNILATPDGHFMATGYIYPIGQAVQAVHYKFKANGDSLWLRLDSAYADNGGLTYPKTNVIGSALLSSGSIVSVGYARRSIPLGIQEVGFVMKMSPDGCVDTLNCWAVPNTEPFAQSDLQVYPNPFVDRLTIDLQGYYPKEAYVYLYDIMGRLLRKERVWNGRNELNVSDFHRGMVFYEVRDGEQVVGRGKLVGSN